MGIEKFSVIVNKHAPESVFEVPLEQFQGYRVAVDMNHLVYRMMDPATKEILARISLAEGKPNRDEIEALALPKILDRLLIMINHGITPVCIMDGYPVDLKKNGNPKKKEQKEKQRAKYQQAKTNLHSAELFFRTTSMMEEFAKQYRANIRVRPAFMDHLKQLLKNLGFPVFGAETFGLATHDAEAICAMLCLSGNDYCFAGYTTDSDFHVYGGNIQIIDIVYREATVGGVRTRRYYAEIRVLENLLEKFAQSAQREFSFDSFQDLCILLGNDFNTNIPQMGEVGSWKTILKYGNIPALSQDRDVSILRYPEVKALFCSTQVQVELDPSQLTFNQDQFKANGRNILLMAELGSYFDRILESLPNLLLTRSAHLPLTSPAKIELEIISDQIADDGETRIELTGLRYALDQIETTELPPTEPTPVNHLIDSTVNHLIEL